MPQARRSPRRSTRTEPVEAALDPVVVEEETEPIAAPAPPSCSFSMCPICTLLTAAGDARPDLMDHMSRAGREVLMGLRTLLDRRLGGQEPGSKLERLKIE